MLESLGALANLEPEFAPVPSSDDRVQEALLAIRTTLRSAEAPPSIESAEIRQEGGGHRVRLRLHWHRLEAADGDAPDGSAREEARACQVWVEVLGGQIRAWHAREVPAQPGDPDNSPQR